MLPVRKFKIMSLLYFEFWIFILGNSFFVLQRRYSGTLLNLHKFFILSITFLSGMGVLCISGFDRISDFHFFLEFPEKSESCMFLLENSGTSLIFSSKPCIHKNFLVWGHVARVPSSCGTRSWSFSKDQMCPQD